MSEAWMVRGSDRQKFVESLMGEIFKADETSKEGGDKDFLLNLVGIIINYFKTMKKESPNLGATFEEDGISGFFLNKIFRPSVIFSRAPEERDYLITRVLEKVIEWEFNRVRSALTTKEIEDPQRIFNAPSAMAEIEL